MTYYNRYMSSKSKDYLDNKKFEELIHQYLVAEDPSIYEDEVVAIFELLINNIINGFKFNVEKEDAKQECFLLILKILKNFKGEKGTAFNYFTTVIVNNLKLIYTRNKKYSDKVESFLEDFKKKNRLT